MLRSASGALIGVALLVWLASAATISARGNDLDAARKAIEAQYARLDAALTSAFDQPVTTLTRRLPLDGIVTRDFRLVDANGKEWGSPWIPADFGTLTTRSAVQHVAIEGNTVRAVVSTVREATSKQGRDKYRVEEIAHDTWIKTRTQWRLRRSVAVHSTTWVNDVLTEDLAARPPLQPALRDAIVGELLARAIPFKTVMPGAGFDDLGVLDQIIGDARIVALGEASHGTAEFFRMKHRLFEYLVERKGFTAFAFEIPWPSMEILDRYVKTGQGTATAALRERGKLVQTQEVRDLIEWMRAYNSVPGRAKLLSLTGFDTAGPKDETAQCVIDALGRLGVAEAETIRRYYASVKDLLPGLWHLKPLSDGEKTKLRADAADALEFVEARREALLQVLTPTEYRRAHRCAVLLVQATMPGANTPLEVANARDRAMAENVKWLVEEAFPNEKIVLWAHNFHVAAATAFKPGFVPMGRHLRQTFGEQMRVFGFAFNRGEVRALPLKDGNPDPGGSTAIKVPAATPDSAEALLRATGLPRFILDLRVLPAAGPLGAWMAEPRRLRVIGVSFDPDNQAAFYDMTPLRKAFDALIFIEESTATVPLN